MISEIIILPIFKTSCHYWPFISMHYNHIKIPLLRPLILQIIFILRITLYLILNFSVAVRPIFFRAYGDFDHHTHADSWLACLDHL